MKILKTSSYKKAFDNYLENSPASGPDIWIGYRQNAVEQVINGKDAWSAVKSCMPTHDMSTEQIESEVKSVISRAREELNSQIEEMPKKIDNSSTTVDPYAGFEGTGKKWRNPITNEIESSSIKKIKTAKWEEYHMDSNGDDRPVPPAPPSQSELVSRIQKIQDFETTIPLFNEGEKKFEQVPVSIGWSENEKGVHLNQVTDMEFGDDLTDLVYDQANKKIFNQLMSEINEIAGNAEADAYEHDDFGEEAAYEAERIPPNVAPNRHNTEPQDLY